MNTKINIVNKPSSSLVPFSKIEIGEVFGYCGNRNNLAIKISDSEIISAQTFTKQMVFSLDELHLTLNARVTIEV